MGAAPVVILGGGFLDMLQFGASPDAAGKSLVLNGTSYTIVGVILFQLQFLRPGSRRLHTHWPVERSLISRSPHLRERARSRPSETRCHPAAGESRYGRCFAPSCRRLSGFQ